MMHGQRNVKTRDLVQQKVLTSKSGNKHSNTFFFCSVIHSVAITVSVCGLSH